MNHDFDLIVKRYPETQNELHVYAIGDVHVGSREFDENAVRKKIQIIKDDPVGCLVVAGDLGDFGLKNSKTNTYTATMQPAEQIELIFELFKDVAHKMTACVPGNHEYRITKEVGLCPLYDLCVRWGVPEVYRENLALTKYIFGNQGNHQPNVFIGLTIHGSTQRKNHIFQMGIEGADFGVSAHVHQPSYTPHGRIRVTRANGTADHVPYKEIVIDANLSPGGYGLKYEYEIPPPPELQYLELRTYRSPDHSRKLHRVMNYHTVQI